MPVRTLPLLSAHELLGCEHRLFLDTSGLQRPGADSDGLSATLRKQAAADHRATMTQRMRALVASEDLAIIDDGPRRQQVDATVAACGSQVEWILNATLPDDREAGRRGRSDMLRFVDDGYVPVIVVNHRITVASDNGGAITSPIGQWDPHPDLGRVVRRQRRDVLRVAHLYRLLLSAGVASSAAYGGVIGVDADCILVYDIAAELPSYDTSFTRRRAIVDGTVATEPSRVGECRTCLWWPRCEEQLVARDDVSLVVNGQQAQALRGEGTTTVAELAAGPQRPDEWSGSPFDDAVVIAQASRASVDLVLRTRTPTCVRADIEIDIDMESYGEHGAYLWGTLRTNTTEPGESPVYRPFVTWDPLPTDDEARSFAQLWQWLMAERDTAHTSGRSFAAYCYSQAAENRWLLGSARTFAGYPGVPSVADVAAFIDSPEWVDIFEAVTDNFVCPHGKGLKKVAPVAGFSWRDAEAGGEASMQWYRHAVGLDGDGVDLSQQERILRYNEDDVWATKVLREWMTSDAVTVVPHIDDLPGVG